MQPAIEDVRKSSPAFKAPGGVPDQVWGNSLQGFGIIPVVGLQLAASSRVVISGAGSQLGTQRLRSWYSVADEVPATGLCIVCFMTHFATG
jgi:hypothetical protein